MIKNQKGITLIALVITIIVLLILAGVSIAMLTGPNGLLTNATNASKNTAEKNAIEKINIALQAIHTEILAQQADDSSWDPTDAENLTSLQSANITSITSGSDDYTVAAAGNVITITYTNEKFNLKVTGSIDVSADNGGAITGAESSALGG